MKNEWLDNIQVKVMKIRKTLSTTEIAEQLFMIFDYAAAKFKVRWWVSVAKLKKLGKADLCSFNQLN